MEFTPYRPEDAAELEEMILAFYQEDTYAEMITPDKIARTLRQFEANPASGRICMFRQDGAIVGYAILIPYWSNEYGGNIESIDELYIKPARRGQAIASTFLEHLAQNPPPNTVALHLEVTAQNERAWNLYTRHGFKPVAYRHMFRKL